MRTYTTTHPSGVTYTTDRLDVAVLTTGWGWKPSTDTDRPIGVDCSGAKTKADLQSYAASLLIADVAGTRAEMEARIVAYHEEHA